MGCHEEEGSALSNPVPGDLHGSKEVLVLEHALPQRHAVLQLPLLRLRSGRWDMSMARDFGRSN